MYISVDECVLCVFFFVVFVFFQAEDGIRDLVRSRGLGDVYKRQKLGARREITDSKSSQTVEEEC